jgi:hypothetical protein
MQLNPRYDGEGVGIDDLAPEIRRWRRKEGWTGEYAEIVGLLTNVFASVLHFTWKGGDTMKFELGQVLTPVRAWPVEECESLFTYALALFRQARSPCRDKAEAGLVREWNRDGRLGGRRLRGDLLAFGR